jgi:hypothetical protein
MTLKSMSWLRTDIEYIKDHDIWRLRRLLNNFPIGSYVKTMSADGGHFEPRSGSLNTTLEGIQCLFQARTWIPTSYVMVFYIFNVCSKSGHGFQRHMSWSFIYSMSVPSQDMDSNVICHGLLYIQCLFQARTWISTSDVMFFYILLKSMSWLGTDIEYIKDHDIWRWNPCPGLEQTLNI